MVALGDQCLDEQAIPLLTKLALRVLAGVAAEGDERAVDAATGQRGACDLDQVAFSGKSHIPGSSRH